MVRGREILVTYGSSAVARRSFRRSCGSRMLFEGERWTGEVHVEDDLKKLGGPNGNEPIVQPS